MRLMYLASGLVLLAAAVGGAQAQSDTKPQSYCVNNKGDFYPYKDGTNCRRGYQLAPGNCRLQTGKIVAAVKEECTRASGTVQLPTPAILAPDIPRPATNPREPGD